MRQLKATLLGTALLAVMLCTGCGTVASGGRCVVHHVVVCWLKEPGNEEARQKIIELSRTFRDIPGVREVKAGQVLPSERALVDGSFDIAVIMTFDSRQALDEYIVHPRHAEAVQNVFRPLAGKIVVYDIVDCRGCDGSACACSR